MAQLDPKALKAQQALARLLQTPPETIIGLLDRLEIPWNKISIEEIPCLVVKWPDLVEGEKRNQTAGPFIKKVVEEMRKENNAL